MNKKFLTALIVVGTLVLGACQEDTTMEELINDTELNTNPGGPSEEEDIEIPGGSD